ncbi:hypothetical protein CCH79_00005234, partial [Gambusia affinis]
MLVLEQEGARTEKPAVTQQSLFSMSQVINLWTSPCDFSVQLSDRCGAVGEQGGVCCGKIQVLEQRRTCTFLFHGYWKPAGLSKSAHICDTPKQEIYNRTAHSNPREERRDHFQIRAAPASTTETMVSMKVTVMMATLAVLCVLATNTHAALYGSCCRRYHPKPKFSDILGFSVQKRIELCNISAIIFHTKKGKRCADPAFGWVLDYVSRIESSHCQKRGQTTLDSVVSPLLGGGTDIRMTNADLRSSIALFHQLQAADVIMQARPASITLAGNG